MSWSNDVASQVALTNYKKEEYARGAGHTTVLVSNLRTATAFAQYEGSIFDDTTAYLPMYQHLLLLLPLQTSKNKAEILPV